MLTDSKIRAAKPKSKPYKLYDQRGLFMLVIELERLSIFVAGFWAANQRVSSGRLAQRA